MPEPEAVIDTDSATDDAWVLRSVPLGGSALSQALQGDPGYGGWLASRPRDAAGWRARVEQIRGQGARADWLTALAPAIAATGRASERLARAEAGGVVVTTGQQPGLFGGPAYTWSKAMSALAMADALEAATGVPVAPVFWAAADDADWVEASVTHLATGQGLSTLRLDGPPTDNVAMADVPLGSMDRTLAALREACGSAAHGKLLQVLEQAYVPHATIGAAYVQLLRALLEPLGIAVLDASHPAYRLAADPLLRRALKQAPQLAHALAARTAEIQAAGFSPQVDVLDALSLVFRTTATSTGAQRDRVRARVPVADAARTVREAEPGTLGANVLLRPVIERALLPTVAYHAGPGELAYFAQADRRSRRRWASTCRWRCHVGPVKCWTDAPCVDVARSASTSSSCARPTWRRPRWRVVPSIPTCRMRSNVCGRRWRRSCAPLAMRWRASMAWCPPRWSPVSRPT